MKSNLQLKANQLNQMMQTEGWKILKEQLDQIRHENIEMFLINRDQNLLRVVDGIDILYQEIKSIFDQAEIDKQTSNS